MEGMGEEKLYFLLLKSVQCKKAQFRAFLRCVSTLFVTDCSYLCMSELKKWQKSSQLSKDEIAKFFSKTEQRFSSLFFNFVLGVKTARVRLDVLLKDLSKKTEER